MKSITLLAGIAALSVLSASAAHADSLPKEMIGGWCPSELGGGYYARNTDGRAYSDGPGLQGLLGLWSKAEKLKTSTSVRLAAESDKSPHQHGECGNRSTLLKKSKTEERKGSRGGNCLKGWMLAVARCSGALVPNISGSMGCDCGPLRGATARKRPCHSGGYRTVGIVGG